MNAKHILIKSHFICQGAKKTELFKGSQGDTSINPSEGDNSNNDAVKHYEKTIIKGLIIKHYLYEIGYLDQGIVRMQCIFTQIRHLL